MTMTPTDAPRTPPESRSPWASLLARLESALVAGTISADDLERLLARSSPTAGRRPTPASVLYALGAVVVFAGCVLAYATVFSSLPWLARVVTPFVFPTVALAASVVLARRGLGWQAEVAGLVGYVAFAAACAASIGTSGWATTAQVTAWYIAGAAAAGVGVAAMLAATVRRPRLAWTGIPAALGIGVVFLTYAIGLPAWALCWVVLAEACAAAAVAWHIRADDRLVFTYAALWSLVGAYAAFLMAAITHDFSQFSVWHAILAVAVALAFVVAGALDVDVLMWLGAVGGAFWVLTIASLVGSATSGAVAVILAGLALVGLGLLVTRLHTRGRLRHGHD
jgi:hypothetical protein